MRALKIDRCISFGYHAKNANINIDVRSPQDNMQMRLDINAMSGVWAYCRVSTRKEEQEDSLEAQQARAKAFATARDLGVRLFVEQASAKNITRRPVLSGLLAEIVTLPPRQRPKYLYVTALDRLFRDMVDGLYIGRTLRSLKITLHVANSGDVGLDSFSGRAMFVGQSMGGDAENEGRSKRARDSWIRRREEGKPTSNKVPYGLQLQGERDVPIPDSAQWVLKAFEWYARGDGTPTIGKRMDGHAPPHIWLTSRVGDDGERIAKERAGTRWEALRVVKLLKQRRYRGTIVDPDLFDAVQRRLADTPKAGSRRIREYPLGGAMRCEGCRRHLHGVATGSTTRYRRADGSVTIYPRIATRYYACVVCHYRLNAERLESAFFSSIGPLVAEPVLILKWMSAPRSSIANAAALTRELSSLQKSIEPSAIQERKNRLFDLAVAASVHEIEFKRQMHRLDLEVVAKRQKAEEIRRMLSADADHQRSIEMATSLLLRFNELYEGATYAVKRELLATLTEALGGLLVSPAGLRWRREVVLCADEQSWDR